ncbi:M14 family zinc carboxypeptidase, partial [Salmonella enterica]|uniref:M14 family zinc carboxypeptidase n=1 Tax=Salmonella enterica TaxID=28901 RepID=UPI00329A22B7
IENGIHAGEIEGKDASMILLREILITKEKRELIDNVILVVVPVFSADGHERFRAYNRINQNGPVEMGWRTTAQNINLNREFMKADAPE